MKGTMTNPQRRNLSGRVITTFFILQAFRYQANITVLLLETALNHKVDRKLLQCISQMFYEEIVERIQCPLKDK